ncbi:hypothetical protein GPJ56_010237 [Histomonas meleagridis]|uniref:uncharacterized protein n=1 Tax=Histomonas meleagridis TaxID=135588 RepID=UPI003559F6C1|nr:hypothetical protein GPJ56_010237 [Histomonas meleagridis]KAH0797105.1 hypothetical protein GO595_010998 [Histomonas meleagridis]
MTNSQASKLQSDSCEKFTTIQELPSRPVPLKLKRVRVSSILSTSYYMMQMKTRKTNDTSQNPDSANPKTVKNVEHSPEDNIIQDKYFEIEEDYVFLSNLAPPPKFKPNTDRYPSGNPTGTWEFPGFDETLDHLYASKEM